MLFTAEKHTHKKKDKKKFCLFNTITSHSLVEVDGPMASQCYSNFETLTFYYQVSTRKFQFVNV